MKKPELLAPAGNLEKLKIAFAYGADAVYIGTPVFGLRKYAPNFTLEDVAEGVELANQTGKKVYVVLNGFAHQSDLDALKHHLPELSRIAPHGFIIADMGVAQLARQLSPNVPVHASTQASITNHYACQYWKNAGAIRIILAREVSLAECQAIRQACDIELEIFVHGAMCASYSGKCVISNYTAARDSNRGGCVQSCRHEYSVVNDKTHAIESKAHLMNAKDMMAIRALPEIITSGVIDSVKIEGRMKSSLYAATAVQTYRRAIDFFVDKIVHNQPISEDDFTPFEAELSKVSNRTFNTGFLEERPFTEACHDQFGGYEKSVEFIGTVKATDPKKGLLIQLKSGFKPDDPLEFITPTGDVIIPDQTYPAPTRPNMLIWMPTQHPIPELSILRRPHA